MLEARRRVKENQEAMLKVLLGVEGHSQVREASFLKNAQDALLRKRSWSCSLAWPTLLRALGSVEFIRLFTDYARDHPYQPVGGALVDGRRFVAWLSDKERLPDLGRVQLLAFDLKYRVRKGMERPRAIGKIAVCRLRNPPYLCIGISLPFLQVKRIVRVPLSKRRMA
jgi:hypothetical protein